MAALYNFRENDRGLQQGRYDELLSNLGLQGFSDARALPAPAAPPPSTPRPQPGSGYVDPIEQIPYNGQLEEYFGDLGEKAKDVGDTWSKEAKKTFSF